MPSAQDGLTLRRSYGERRRGSLTDLAEVIYRTIRAGDSNLTKALNVSKKSQAVTDAARARRKEMHDRKQAAHDNLLAQIDVKHFDANAMLTGYYIRREDLRPAGEAAAGLVPAETTVK